MGFSQAGYLVPKFSDALIPAQPAASAGPEARTAAIADVRTNAAATPPVPGPGAHPDLMDETGDARANGSGTAPTPGT
jgi:hypothetical protein